MNSLFFNKTKTLDNNLEENSLDVSFVKPSDILCAGICNLTGDEVLMLNSDLVDETLETLSVENFGSDRIQPFYSKGNYGGIKVNSKVAGIGYKKAKNQTFLVQQNATRQAKFVYLNYVRLLNSLNKMQSHAPNNNVKNDIAGLKQEVLISTAVMGNIIRVISANQNPMLEAVSQANNNMAFCNELRNALRISDSIIFGLIRLNRMVNIPQISKQITILTLSANNIHNNLRGMLSYC